jgi:quercetin dioxygenase-like cupin family protein
MVQLVPFTDLAWEGPKLDEAPDDQRSAWQHFGPPARARVLQGEGGYYVELVTFPAGFEVYPHSHDRDELFVILEGGCRFEDRDLGVNDTLMIPANTAYSFTAGSRGMRFLIVRSGPAAYADRRPEE